MKKTGGVVIGNEGPHLLFSHDSEKKVLTIEVKPRNVNEAFTSIDITHVDIRNLLDLSIVITELSQHCLPEI